MCMLDLYHPNVTSKCNSFEIKNLFCKEKQNKLYFILGRGA